MTKGPLSSHLGWVVALDGHPVAFRFVHITLSQGRKVGMFGRRREPGLRPWLKVIAPVSGDGMTTQLGVCAA
ncbi:hypothetical protein GCM10022380_76480 [Amycolatopsis tucumanensis]|uniref:Uncharacterized protein n=1 Tax=Amycolatopsis tucumanensis TaxID=401106 RepID=A0ABP7JL50_9PSEU